MATHSSILACRIPGTEEPGGLLSIGSHRARQNWSDLACMHALEKEMATHSSVLAWRIPGTGEPGGLPSMGSHRVRHDWSDLAAAAAAMSTKNMWQVCVSRRGRTWRPGDQTPLWAPWSQPGPNICFHLHVNCPSPKSHSTSLSIFFCLSWRWHLRQSCWPFWLFTPFSSGSLMYCSVTQSHPSLPPAVVAPGPSHWSTREFLVSCQFRTREPRRGEAHFFLLDNTDQDSIFDLSLIESGSPVAS